jgi:hypothetical protein
MDQIEIQTLIDVTSTKINRNTQGNQQQIDQYKNFITLRQCIEIRSIIEYRDPPRVEELDVKKLGFGSGFKGKQKVWIFKFQTDRSGVYLDENGDPIGMLLEDIHEVPIIKNLTETINIDKSIFDCKDPIKKNTIIKVLPASGE